MAYGMTDPAYWVPRIKWQESRNNPYAVSPVGASGTMQTMPGTLTNPGFGVKPFDPSAPDPYAEKERVGVDYWNAMFNRYPGDVPRALAAYNWGPDRADKWNGDLSVLPAETRNYIQKVMGGDTMADPMGILAMAANAQGVPDIPPPDESGVKGLATDPLFNLGIGILKGAGPSRLPVTFGSALGAGGQQLSDAGQLAQKNEYNRLKLLQENSQQKMAAAMQGIQLAGLLQEQQRKGQEAKREAAELRFKVGGGLGAADTAISALERLKQSAIGRKLLANHEFISTLRADPTGVLDWGVKNASKFFSGEPVDDAAYQQALNDVDTVEKARNTLSSSLQVAGSRGNTGAFGLQQTLIGQGAGAGIDVQLEKFRESRDLLKNFWGESDLGDVPSFGAGSTMPVTGPIISDPFAPTPQGGAPQQTAGQPVQPAATAAGPSFIDRAGAYLSGAGDTVQQGAQTALEAAKPIIQGATQKAREYGGQASQAAQSAAEAAPGAAAAATQTATEAAQGAAQAAQSVSAKATGAAKEAWGKALPIIQDAKANGWQMATGGVDYVARALAAVDAGMSKGEAKKFLREQGITRQALIDRGIAPSLLGF